MDYSQYPRPVVEDIVRLRRRIQKSGVPEKRVDQNVIIATWNLRSFGRVYEQWGENPGDPKRNLRAMSCIAEIIRQFDVIAIQEVKGDTSALRFLLREFLGSNWGVLMSDISAGSGGNTERLAYVYDKRRVEPSGLAGEIVLPPTEKGDPMTQFDRTPYIVGFRSGAESFSLLTTHIKYGKEAVDRVGELKGLADYIAAELRSRAKTRGEENNLIVLGDFNIEDRGDNPLFQAFVSSGLTVPSQLLGLRTTYDTKPKFYDQIAWFMGDLNLLSNGKAGVVDFAGAIFKEMEPKQMSFRVSDHFPLWVEFITDRSTDCMARSLGVNSDGPDPFAGVPD